MASAVAMMVGGALVNALAFSGSNYLFSHMGKSMMLKKKERDMIKLRNNYKRHRLHGIKKECRD